MVFGLFFALPGSAVQFELYGKGCDEKADCAKTKPPKIGLFREGSVVLKPPKTCTFPYTTITLIHIIDLL